MEIGMTHREYVMEFTSHALEFTFWAILLIESLLGFACLLAGISFWWKARKNRTDAITLASTALNDVKAIAGTEADWKNESQRAVLIDRCRSELAKREDGFGRVLHCLFTPKAEQAGIEALIGLHVHRLERGAIRLCGFLARTAPLAGLAGTILGVQQALNAFAANPGDTDAVISGFATALGTTLVGIVIAFACLIPKAVWEAVLTNSMGVLLEAALIVKSDIDPLIHAPMPVNGKKPTHRHRKPAPQIRQVRGNRRPVRSKREKK